MKKVIAALTGLVLSLITLTASAQVHRCSTVEHEAELLIRHPKRGNQRAAFEQIVEEYSQLNSINRTQNAIITIPVVVHVVYNSASQNVSTAQIISQIEVLNQDFARLNADTNNTPIAFRPVASGTTIQFCLAQRDPNGQPTTGVERRSSNVASWSTNDAVKSFASGGLNAWNPAKYFNIWVCRLSNGVLGYAEFPTTSLSNTYGVVIDYQSFGTIGTATAPYNEGRTATHEVGHCFNLKHIWGDDGSACSGTDNCADTPNQSSENYGCPNYPLTDGCSSTNPGVMFMNYMDYVDDGCMNMFTLNQVTRMNAVVNNPPYNALAASDGCQPVLVVTDDARLAGINSPSGTICAGQFTPSITLSNAGTNPLTSVNITYVIDGGTPVTLNWTGNLAAAGTIAVSLTPATVSTSGVHTILVYTSSPNGNADNNTTNDSLTVSFNVNGSIGTVLPYVQGFETSPFPPTGITINNPDGSYTWEQSNLAAKTGTYSILMDNFDYDGTGQIDELELPALDFTSGATANTTPYMSFQVAYQLYTSPSANPSYSDTLEILVSSDCGTTFTSVYKKFGTALTTAIPTFSTTEFIPSASQWRKDSINLAAFENFNSVIVKLHHVTDFENSLFVDDININQVTSTGLSVITEPLISVFPNPVSDVLGIRPREASRIEIYDAKGQKVYDSVEILRQDLITIPIEKFATGIYSIRATSISETFTTKFVKQ